MSSHLVATHTFVPQFMLPETVDALIEMLDHSLFPTKTPAETDTFAQMHRYAGQRSVVDLLRSLQAERKDIARSKMK